jgi:excisionase family DNA binding protein
VKEILTASQVAALLQVHLRTVYKLAQQGTIPGRKFGGGWRFSKSEILKMVTRNEGKGHLEPDWSREKGDGK